MQAVRRISGGGREVGQSGEGRCRAVEADEQRQFGGQYLARDSEVGEHRVAAGGDRRVAQLRDEIQRVGQRVAAGLPLAAREKVLHHEARLAGDVEQAPAVVAAFPGLIESLEIKDRQRLGGGS